MHIKPPTPREMLSHELITSPPKNKSITIFESLVIDLEKDKE
jgi:hypothetical protein